MSEEALRRLRELRREHAALVRALDRANYRVLQGWDTDPRVFASLAVEVLRGVEKEIERWEAEVWRGDGI